MVPRSPGLWRRSALPPALLLLGASCALGAASCRRLIVPSSYEVTVEARSRRNPAYSELATHRYVISSLGDRGMAVHVVECGGAPVRRAAVALDKEGLATVWRTLEAQDAWELRDDFSGGGAWRWKVSLREGGELHSFALHGEGGTPQAEIVRLVRDAAGAQAPQPEPCSDPEDAPSP